MLILGGTVGLMCTRLASTSTRSMVREVLVALNAEHILNFSLVSGVV